MSDKRDPLHDLADGEILFTRENFIFNTQRQKAEQMGVTVIKMNFLQWAELLLEYDWHCAFCDGPYEQMTFLIPLDQGGSFTVRNAYPACKTCHESRQILFSALMHFRQTVIVGKRLNSVYDIAGHWVNELLIREEEFTQSPAIDRVFWARIFSPLENLAWEGAPTA